MTLKVQARTSLTAGSLSLKKDAIFPTGRMREALKERGRGCSARSERAGPALPVRARRRGIFLRGPHKKGREGAFSSRSLLSLSTQANPACVGGDLLARTGGRRRSERSPCPGRRERALREPRSGQRRAACDRRGSLRGDSGTPSRRGAARPGGSTQRGSGAPAAADPAPSRWDEALYGCPSPPPCRGGAPRGA